MTTLIVTIHIVACVALIALVLLQSGKEGMGVIFGGGSQSVFGSTGAGGLLVKLSAIFGAIFLITSLAYNYYAGAERRPNAESVMTSVTMEEKQSPPAGVAPEAAKTEEAGNKSSVTFEEKAPETGAATEAAKSDAVKTEEAAKPQEAAPAAPVEEKKDTAPAQ